MVMTMPRLPAQIPLARRQQMAPESAAVVPAHFRCPISLELMRDPVTAPTGITYDRDSVERWLERGHGTCPVTGRPVAAEELIPNHATRRMIQEWCVANRALGVERVPTPRAPVAASDAAELLAAAAAAARRGDGDGCRKAVAAVRALGKESERNRRCFASAGAGRVLSCAFQQLAGEPVDAAAAPGALEEILAALVAFFPLDDESRRHIASPASLKSVVSILSHGGELAARVSAVVVLRELTSSADSQTLAAVARTSGLCEALVRVLEKPVSAQATKAALVTAYYLAAADERAGARLADLGLVALLVELLVDADKGASEKALAAMDSVLRAERGRESARAHALAVPVLVKKMFRVSDMATEFAVSALWRMCKADLAGDAVGRCRAEAMQVGAFQKLLLLLQVGCEGATKERASELLKLLNESRGRAECIETVDFKGLKRPF